MDRAWPIEAFSDLAQNKDERQPMKRTLNQSRCALRLTTLVSTGFISAGILLAGCASTSESTARQQAGSGTDVDDMTLEQTAQFAEDRYIIGPRTANEFDYRIGWQRTPSTDAIDHFELSGDSVFALDGQNFLARMRASDGVRLWRVPILKPIEEVYGIAFIPERDRVYVTAGGVLVELDGSTGNQLSRQELSKVAATGPTEYGNFILYGARNGQLVWHSLDAQYLWKSYQMAPSIVVKPVVDDSREYVVSSGSNGRLMVLRVSNASQMWNTQLLGDVVAEPAAVNGVVYVSSLDQHLRAYDMETGRKLWAILTASPLSTSPSVIGDRVYQEIPDVGLVCMEALPFDAPGGVEVWRTDGTTGSVITQRNNDLILWDGESRTLTIVDGKHGAVMKSMELPKVKYLYSSGLVEGVLYAVSDTGVVQRLIPRGS